MAPEVITTATLTPNPSSSPSYDVVPTNSTGGGGGSGVISVDNLYPAILQCFVVVVSGYVAGRTGHVTASQGRGIAKFVATFCLPALLFRSMCTLDFSEVNWYFLLAILIAKMSIFIIVAALTLLVKRPLNLAYAGIFAIFCTQSNDFALGYPILKALYEDTHPEYLNYIYLISPISLLILNPIGFAMMEIHRHYAQPLKPESSDPDTQEETKSTSRRRRLDSTRSTDSVKSGNGFGPEGSTREAVPPEERTWAKALLQVAKGVLLNPIVFMTAVGIAGNFVFSQQVPAVLDDILTVLGNAFSASALFYLGLSMVGKVQNQMGLGLMLPLLLIFAKSLVLPLVTWEVVSWLQPNETASRSLSMYGFLYGTFPTAPSVLLYATQYGLAHHTVATGMVAGTFLSAPLMFVSAKMMSVGVSSDMDYHSLLFDTAFDSSIVGIICCIWVLGILVLSGRWKRVPHRFTFCLVLSQLLACIGMLAYREKGTTATWRHYIQFVTLLVGVFASRCWTAALALALCLLHTRSLCCVLKSQVWFGFLGFGFPVLMTGLMFLVGAKHISDTIDPSFHYGFLQTLFSAIVLLVSILITMASIVVWQRNERHHSAGSNYKSINPSPSTPPKASGANTSAGAEEGFGGNIQQHATSPPLSPTQQHRNYQACAASLNCSAVNIEDIVPFPSDDSKTILSDESCSEDHGPVGAYAVPMDERTCLLNQCTTEERLACRQRLRRYAADQQNFIDSPQEEGTQDQQDSLRQEYQTTHHLLLLILLSVSMFVGLFLCIWKIFNDQVSGIYVEIEFLDSVFNYGQSFLVFTVFGFDTRLVFSPIMRRIRRWMYGAELVHIPKPWELDDDTQTTCHQFINFHIHTCRSRICKDRRFRLRRYSNVFTGAEFCDWLIEAGLAADKAEAVAYGRRLVLGRVISHVTGMHHFQHSPFFYKFVDADDADC